MEPGDFTTPEKAIWSDEYSSLTRQNTRFGSFVSIDFPDGRPLCGAGVLAFDGTNILLVQLRRPAIHQKVWELPAGGIEAGESPRDAAVRELYEETGVPVAAADLILLGDVVGLAARSSNVGTYFFAAVPAGSAHAPRDTEISLSAWVPLDVAVHAIVAGAINDGYTIATVLRAMHRGLLDRA